MINCVFFRTREPSELSPNKVLCWGEILMIFPGKYSFCSCLMNLLSNAFVNCFVYKQKSEQLLQLLTDNLSSKADCNGIKSTTVDKSTNIPSASTSPQPQLPGFNGYHHDVPSPTTKPLGDTASSSNCKKQRSSSRVADEDSSSSFDGSDNSSTLLGTLCDSLNSRVQLQSLGYESRQSPSNTPTNAVRLYVLYYLAFKTIILALWKKISYC